MSLGRAESGRRWLALFFAIILAMIALTAVWWTYGAPQETAPKAMQSTALPQASTDPPIGGADRFGQLLASLGPDALAKGVSATTFANATAGLSLDPEIAGLAANQPEHIRSAGDYLALLVSETRVANGRAKLAEHAAELAALEARFGVDRHVLVAIWGIESAYGTSMGERGVVRSLATLAATDTRRPGFWRNELVAALQILERGDVTPERMTGSWAGAMGHTQFMPTTYLAHAADFDGDGRRDIWAANPLDALASAANYLKASGWAQGQRAMIEVRLPDGFDYALAAPGERKTLVEWQALGVVPLSPPPPSPPPSPMSQPPSDSGRLALVVPAGHRGPAFLTGAGFRAILRYNNAVPYALAVAHLADRLAGGGPFATPWPSDDRGLSRAEREELQARLVALGHDIGSVDGIVGTATRAAIRVVQKERGFPADGHADAIFLEVLRAGSPGRPSAP